MIILSEISERLGRILNGTDEQTEAIRPTDRHFVVATQGYHLDSISDIGERRNSIPVYVSSMDGTINPIPKLNDASYSIPVSIYFPLRLKEEFYGLAQFVAEALVGIESDWGAVSGRALSNVSVARFEDIVDLDLQQFASWYGGTYSLPLEVSEPWMAMTFTLYLSTLAQGYAFGNSARMVMTVPTFNPFVPGQEVTEEVLMTESSFQAMSEMASQQRLEGSGPSIGTGRIVAQSAVSSTAMTISLEIYYDRRNRVCQQLLQSYRLRPNEFWAKLSYVVDGYSLGIDGKWVISSMRMGARRGQPLTISLALTKGID